MAVIGAAVGAIGRSRTRFLDVYMVVVTVALVTFGLLAIYSADGGGALTGGNDAVRQFTFYTVGLGLMAICALADYRIFARLAWVIYGVNLVLLLLVLRVGTVIGGSSRWLDFGPLTYQPSEGAKLAVALALAAFVAGRGERMRYSYNFLISLVIVGVPAALVYRQPDLGTALVFLAIWCGIMLFSKTRPWYFLLIVAVVVPTMIAVWERIPEYQRSRFDAFLDPYSKENIRGEGYNIIQALNSTRSGGLTGQGMRGGALGEFNYLSVRTTDFIFAHAASMFGFIGCLALLTLFLMLFWRYTKVIATAGDEFGRLVAVGLTAQLLFQTVVNIGMNIQLLPVTGIPLPFVSLGGSALWMLLAGQGILQSILIRHRKFVI